MANALQFDFVIARFARGDVRWVAAVFVRDDGTESVVPPSPPAHSPPLGLVLAPLAQSCGEIGGANIVNPPTSLAEGRTVEDSGARAWAQHGARFPDARNLFCDCSQSE